jgi:nucleoside-diphosphate-sugar epimerase
MALNTVALESKSISDLVGLIVTRYPTMVEYGDPRPGDVPPARVSSDLIERELGWKAEVSFEEGIDELMAGLDKGV